MKKILLLTIFLIVLSGCEATYTIEIMGNNYHERLEVNNYNVNSWGSGEASYNNIIRVNAGAYTETDYRDVENYDDNSIRPGISYYEKKLINKADNLGVEYNHTFTLQEYRHSNIVLTHFESFNIKNNNQKISFNSGKKNRIFLANPDLEKLTVILKTNHEVLLSNADEVKNNIHYWYIDRNNYEEKIINVELSESYDVKTDLWQTDEKGYFGTNSLIALYILISSVCLIGLGAIYIKVANSNR